MRAALLKIVSADIDGGCCSVESTIWLEGLSRPIGLLQLDRAFTEGNDEIEILLLQRHD